MYRLFIGLRYLRRKRISILAMLGVAAGVMVLIVVHSVMTGFDQELRSRIRGNLSDLVLETWGGRNFGNYMEVVEYLEGMDHIEACSPRLEGIALYSHSHTEQFEPVGFLGIDLEREAGTTRLAEYWLAGQREIISRGHYHGNEHEIIPDPNWGGETDPGVSPAIIGFELAVYARGIDDKELFLDIGDRVVLMTAQGVFDRGILPTKIAGKFKSGMYEYDKRMIYIPLDEAQMLMDVGRQINSISIRLDDYANAHVARAEILGIPTLDELRRMRRMLRRAIDRADNIVSMPGEARMDELEENYYRWRDTGHPFYVSNTLYMMRVYTGAVEYLERADALEGFRGAGDLIELRDRLQQRREKSLANEFGENFRISTWEDKQRNILSAVQIERTIAVVIYSLLIPVAWLLIYSILSSMVAEKVKDIGILKSLGATMGGIMSIFVLNGFIIGIIGGVLGIFGGMLFTANINQIADFIYAVTGAQVFPAEIYYLEAIPVDQDPVGWMITVSVMAIIVSVLASLYPAWKAARMSAVDALRYE